MPYIGTNIPTGNYRKLTNIASSFNGITTTFQLSVPPGTAQYFVTPRSVNQLIISVGGVVQEPGVDFTLNGSQITFTTAPAAGLTFFGILMGDALNVGAPSDGTVTTPKLADGALSADSNGLAKMADGFFTATAGTLAKFADGFLAATTAGRAKMADGFITTPKVGDAQITPAKLAQPLTLATSVASTSGTSIDFTGIPSWVKRITVMFNGVSTNGASIVQVRLGTSAGFTTSGYLGGVASAASFASHSAGFLVNQASDATSVRHGNLYLVNVTGNTWSANSSIAISQNTRVDSMGGTITLSGTLDRIRITTVNGTDTFDAGSINILYEG